MTHTSIQNMCITGLDEDLGLEKNVNEKFGQRRDYVRFSAFFRLFSKFPFFGTSVTGGISCTFLCQKSVLGLSVCHYVCLSV